MPVIIDGDEMEPVEALRTRPSGNVPWPLPEQVKTLFLRVQLRRSLNPASPTGVENVYGLVPPLTSSLQPAYLLYCVPPGQLCVSIDKAVDPLVEV